MRRSHLLLAAAALAVALPSQAKMPFVKKAQELGIASVKNCASCHVGAPKKGGDFTDMGKWLVAQKATKKAAEVDVAWLKDYKGK
jgi:mono/diheme cytochrome c family protein